MKPQIFNLKQCDPKKCSGKRIIKFEIVNEVNKKGIRNSILLSPFSNKIYINSCAIVGLPKPPLIAKRLSFVSN